MGSFQEAFARLLYTFTGNIDKTSKILLNYFKYDTITLLSQTVFSQLEF